MAPVTLRQYEADKREPRQKQLRDLAAALDVSPLALMGMDTPEVERLAEADAQRLGLSQAEAEQGIVEEVLAGEAIERTFGALRASEDAVFRAFQGVPEHDIKRCLWAIIQDELTREGQILLLKRAHELAMRYDRLRPPEERK